MTVIVYRIGKEDLAYQIISENTFEVIGFSDGYKDRWGTELIYNRVE